MSKSIVSRTLSVHQEHELLGKLEAAGLSSDDAQRVIESRGNGLAQACVAFIRRGGAMPVIRETESQLAARNVMGKNFIGLPEVVEHLNIVPTEEQLKALADIPFSENVLKECSQTHVLVPVLPLSILELRDKVKRDLFYSHEDAWYNGEAFAGSEGDCSWQLVRKDIVPNSTNKNWKEQQKFLGNDEDVPSAQVMVYTIILNYLVRGERMLEHIYARTSSVTSHGRRVYVGRFGGCGLGVDDGGWDGGRGDSVGVASARK